MFLHIGNGVNVRCKEIVGIFDLDTATMAPETREFLKRTEKKERLTDCAKGEIPRSFVLSCEKKGKEDEETVRLSLISSGGLRARAESGWQVQKENEDEQIMKIHG
jgi:hypothetical protein